MTMKYQFAIEVKPFDDVALDTVVSATEKLFKSLRVTILERGQDEDDYVAYWTVESAKQLVSMIDKFDDLPGNVSIEPL